MYLIDSSVCGKSFFSCRFKIWQKSTEFKPDFSSWEWQRFREIFALDWQLYFYDLPAVWTKSLAKILFFFFEKLFSINFVMKVFSTNILSTTIAIHCQPQRPERSSHLGLIIDCSWWYYLLTLIANLRVTIIPKD